jgi:hypothetical protein
MTVLIATLQTALTSDKAVDKKAALRLAKIDGCEICALNKSKADMDTCIKRLIGLLTEEATPVAVAAPPEEVTPPPEEVTPPPEEVTAPPEEVIDDYPYATESTPVTSMQVALIPVNSTQLATIHPQSTQVTIMRKSDMSENQAAPLLLMIAVCCILLDQVRLLFLFFIPTPLESLQAMGSRLKNEVHSTMREFDPLVDFIGSALSP